MAKMSKLDILAIILLIVGGLNWGLVGLLNFNLVTSIFGIGTITKIVYILVGIAAVYSIIKVPKK